MIDLGLLIRRVETMLPSCRAVIEPVSGRMEVTLPYTINGVEVNSQATVNLTGIDLHNMDNRIEEIRYKTGIKAMQYYLQATSRVPEFAPSK